MILSQTDFQKSVKSGAAVACLPQSEGDWCLVVKAGSTTGYLGDDGGEAVYFPTLDAAVVRAIGLEVAEVLVITGVKQWRF